MPAQNSLFDDVSARRSDPSSSHVTVQSIVRDVALADWVMRAVYSCSRRDEIRHYSDGDSIAEIYDRPVTDDDVWAYVERNTDRRWQRNVIARARGRLEKLGVLERVKDVLNPDTGRWTIAYIPTRGTRE